MVKIQFSSKYIILVLCAVALVALLWTAHFIMSGSRSNSSVSLKNAGINDFNFKLNFNVLGKEQLDTYKGTYTKDLVLNGTKTIDFKIPDNVKSEIYKLMMDVNILSFPDTLKAGSMLVMPSCDYKLTVTINGKTKNIIWKDGLYPSMKDSLPKDNKNFLKIVKYISDYIYSTEEYKNMPQANGGYE